jgi:hypothetical protein
MKCNETTYQYNHMLQRQQAPADHQSIAQDTEILHIPLTKLEYGMPETYRIACFLTHQRLFPRVE